MKKTMLELSVFTENGFIVIEGPQYMNAHGEDTRDSIYLAPEQVDVLIKWLQEAKNELCGD